MNGLGRVVVTGERAGRLTTLSLAVLARRRVGRLVVVLALVPAVARLGIGLSDTARLLVFDRCIVHWYLPAMLPLDPAATYLPNSTSTRSGG
ncbi:MAG: hypothetical protein ACFBWO_14520 [Paracoccaceae bacterium]